MRISVAIYTFILCICWSTGVYGQDDILGKWVSVDDKSNRKRSIVELNQNDDGTLTGTILEVFPGPGEDADPICDKCDGAEKNQRIIGMTIIKNLKENNGVWSGGSILDPESGRTYDCKIWVEGNRLMVRGYLYFFYRTQEWTRLN